MIYIVYSTHTHLYWNFNISLLLQIILKFYFNQMNLGSCFTTSSSPKKGHHILFSAVTFAFYRRNSCPQKMPASTSCVFFCFERIGPNMYHSFHRGHPYRNWWNHVDPQLMLTSFFSYLKRIPMVLSTPLPASPALENRARCPGGVSTLKGRYQSVLCDGRDAHLQMYITGGGWEIRRRSFRQIFQGNITGKI